MTGKQRLNLNAHQLRSKVRKERLEAGTREGWHPVDTSKTKEHQFNVEEPSVKKDVKAAAKEGAKEAAVGLATGALGYAAGAARGVRRGYKLAKGAAELYQTNKSVKRGTTVYKAGKAVVKDVAAEARAARRAEEHAARLKGLRERVGEVKDTLDPTFHRRAGTNRLPEADLRRMEKAKLAKRAKIHGKDY